MSTWYSASTSSAASVVKLPPLAADVSSRERFRYQLTEQYLNEASEWTIVADRELLSLAQIVIKRQNISDGILHSFVLFHVLLKWCGVCFDCCLCLQC